MWPGDSQAERHFAGRAVGDGARVVVMRPNAGVVVELGDLEDFVFGLDVAVLGDADENADAILADVWPRQAAVLDRFVGTVDRDGAGACPAADVFPLLVFQRIEVADAGQRLADVADLVLADAGFSCQQIGPVFSQSVAVGSGQADAGDDNALIRIGHRRAATPRKRIAPTIDAAERDGEVSRRFGPSQAAELASRQDFLLIDFAERCYGPPAIPLPVGSPSDIGLSAI